MAAFSRGLRLFAPRGELTCSRCLQFSTTSIAQSGHNRWSKIKHDKGAVDAKKNVQRSALSKEIALVSKSMKLYSLKFSVANEFAVYGGDPSTNPRLATVLATAKKGR
jgi:transcriptional/translational regulatory protein YebC/TACO1